MRLILTILLLGVVCAYGQNQPLYNAYLQNNLNANTNSIVNLTTGTGVNNAATKGYVDAAVISGSVAYAATSGSSVLSGSSAISGSSIYSGSSINSGTSIFSSTAQSVSASFDSNYLSGGILIFNFRQNGSDFLSGNERGSVAYTVDGNQMTEIYGLDSYSPPLGGVRDVAGLKFSGSYFALYTTCNSGTELGYIGEAISPQLTSWSHLTDIYLSGTNLSPTSPRWFIDASGNRWMLCFDANSNSLYAIQNTTPDGETWSNQFGPFLFTTGTAINGRDGCVIYKYPNYYLYFFDYSDSGYYHLATNPTWSATGWSDQGRVTNWNPSGAGETEGACIVLLPSGTYQAYFAALNIDPIYGTEIAWETTKSVDLGNDWTYPIVTQQPRYIRGSVADGYDNGGALPVIDDATKHDIAAAIAAQSNHAPQNNGIFVFTDTYSPSFWGTLYDGVHRGFILSGSNAPGQFEGMVGDPLDPYLSFSQTTNGIFQFSTGGTSRLIFDSSGGIYTPTGTVNISHSNVLGINSAIIGIDSNIDSVQFLPLANMAFEVGGSGSNIYLSDFQNGTGGQAGFWIPGQKLWYVDVLGNTYSLGNIISASGTFIGNGSGLTGTASSLTSGTSVDALALITGTGGIASANGNARKLYASSGASVINWTTTGSDSNSMLSFDSGSNAYFNQSVTFGGTLSGNASGLTHIPFTTVTGTLSAGTWMGTNAAFIGGGTRSIIVDTSGSGSNFGGLSLSISGSVATVQSSNTLDASTFNIIVFP